MIYNIYNEFIEVAVSDAGAELMSVKSRKDGTEYLWQGNPEFWGGRAYNLFPICGRLTEGKYTYEGKTYEMNLHGFVRKSVLSATVLACDKVEFSLRSDERTLSMYPFDFEYRIRYTLVKNTVRMEISVVNLSRKVMPFSIGGHPGFNVPLGEGKDETFEDYYIEFSPACSPDAIYMSDTCYTTRRTDAFPLENGRILPLRHDLFDRDAIVLENVSHKVSLRSKKTSKCVTVETPDAMKYLAIWHAPRKAAPYVALEPWTSVPAYDGEIDDLSSKRDMTQLSPLASYELTWTITVE